MNNKFILSLAATIFASSSVFATTGANRIFQFDDLEAQTEPSSKKKKKAISKSRSVASGSSKSEDITWVGPTNYREANLDVRKKLDDIKNGKYGDGTSKYALIVYVGSQGDYHFGLGVGSLLNVFKMKDSSLLQVGKIVNVSGSRWAKIKVKLKNKKAKTVQYYDNSSALVEFSTDWWEKIVSNRYLKRVIVELLSGNYGKQAAVYLDKDEQSKYGLAVTVDYGRLKLITFDLADSYYKVRTVLKLIKDSNQGISILINSDLQNTSYYSQDIKKTAPLAAVKSDGYEGYKGLKELMSKFSMYNASQDELAMLIDKDDKGYAKFAFVTKLIKFGRNYSKFRGKDVKSIVYFVSKINDDSAKIGDVFAYSNYRLYRKLNFVEFKNRKFIAYEGSLKAATMKFNVSAPAELKALQKEFKAYSKATGSRLAKFISRHDRLAVFEVILTKNVDGKQIKFIDHVVADSGSFASGYIVNLSNKNGTKNVGNYTDLTYYSKITAADKKSNSKGKKIAKDLKELRKVSKRIAKKMQVTREAQEGELLLEGEFKAISTRVQDDIAAENQN